MTVGAKPRYRDSTPAIVGAAARLPSGIDLRAFASGMLRAHAEQPGDTGQRCESPGSDNLTPLPGNGSADVVAMIADVVRDAWTDARLPGRGPSEGRCGLVLSVADDDPMDGPLIERVAAALGISGPRRSVSGDDIRLLAGLRVAVSLLEGGQCDVALLGDLTARHRPGCAALVLRPIGDARRSGNHVYGVVSALAYERAPGSTSDNAGAPLQVGLLRHLLATTEIDPRSIGLVELYVSGGIPIGTELVRELSDCLGGNDRAAPRCRLGSGTSSRSASDRSSTASVLQTVLSIDRRVLPASCVNLDVGRWQQGETALFLLDAPRPWIQSRDQPRRAVMLATGSSGAASAIVLDEDPEAAPAGDSPGDVDWPSELVLLSGRDRVELLRQIARVREATRSQSPPRLVDLVSRFRLVRGRRHRLAVVASDLTDLDDKLKVAAERIEHQSGPAFQSRRGIFYADVGNQPAPGKTALLFPGMGSQYHHMLADLCIYLPETRGWFDRLDEWFGTGDGLPPSMMLFPPAGEQTVDEQHALKRHLYKLEGGGQAGFLATIAMSEFIEDLEIPSDAMVGYSNGENTALLVSGLWRVARRRELYRLLVRLQVDSIGAENIHTDVARGVTLVVSRFRREELDALIAANEDVHLTLDNCPNQVVLFGTDDGIADIERRLRNRGAICFRLPFDRPYHTPLFRAKQKYLERLYEQFDIGPGRVPVYSCGHMRRFPDDPVEIRRLAVEQWMRPVRFREMVLMLHQEGVRNFVEVGPGGKLTGFVDDTLRGEDHLAVALNAEGRPGFWQLQQAVGQLFVRGVAVNANWFLDVRGLRQPDLEEHEPALVSAVVAQVASVSVAGAADLTDLTGPIASAHPAAFAAPAAASAVVTDRPVTAAPAATAPAIAPAPVIAAGRVGSGRLAVLKDHFDLMAAFLESQQRVAAALFGPHDSPVVTLPPVRSPRRSADRWLLAGLVVESSGDHAYTELRLDPDDHPFVKDHRLGPPASPEGGEPPALHVVPFTFAMEIAAEAASRLIGDDFVVVQLDAMRSHRWIALDRGELALGVDARVEARTRDGCTVRVRLLDREADGDGGRGALAFETEVRLARRFEEPSAPSAPIGPTETPPRLTADSYYGISFHGPSFKGVRDVRFVTEEGIEAEVEVPALDSLVATAASPELELPASLLDVVGQLVAHWLLERGHVDFTLFPAATKSYRQFTPSPPAGTRLTARVRLRSAGRMTNADADLIDRQGRLVAQVSGLRSRYYPMPSGFVPALFHASASTFFTRSCMAEAAGVVCRRIDELTPALLDETQGIVKRALVSMVLTPLERKVWDGLPDMTNRRAQWLLGRIAAKDAVRQWAHEQVGLTLLPVDVEIVPDDWGKPRVACAQLAALAGMPDVSISHSRDVAVAAAVSRGSRVGIDVQHADDKGPGEWLREAFSEDELALLRGEGRDRLVSLWSAKEAAAKAVGIGLLGLGRRWRVAAVNDAMDSVTILYDGEELPVRVWVREQVVTALCCIPAAQAEELKVRRVTGGDT